MASRAEEQRQRYLRTPCPAKVSRKKLRQLMWRNRPNLTSKALFAEMKREPGQKRPYRGPNTTIDKLATFKDIISSVGGFFQEFDHTGERKKHTSGRRENRR